MLAFAIFLFSMSRYNRREFIPLFAGSLAGLAFSFKTENLEGVPPEIIAPHRLKTGDTIGITCPAGPVRKTQEVEEFRSILHQLGFKTMVGESVKRKTGFLAGTDEQRAKEFMGMVKDPAIQGIFCMKGGWGSARIAPLLDYSSIRKSRKVVMGFSDITTLLNAIYLHSGLITFHGPVGNSSWNNFSVDYVRNILMEGKKLDYGKGFFSSDEMKIMNTGMTKGRLIGGNLSVLSGLMGTGFLPKPEGHILFLEEVKEEPFRIDRMLTQFKLAGWWEKLNGVILGKFRDCVAEEPEFSFTVEEVLKDHFSSLKIPVLWDAPIGHVRDKYCLPVGAEVLLDASKGSFSLLSEPVN